RPSSAASFFWSSTRASARSARPVSCASCRSSSAIFRSRGSTGVGLPPFLWRQGSQLPPAPRPSPHHQVRRVQPLAPQQRPDGPRCRARVGLLEDAPLVLGGVRPPLWLRRHLHVLRHYPCLPVHVLIIPSRPHH